MNLQPPKKFPEGTLLILEAVAFFGIAYLGRTLLDQVLSAIGVSDLLAIIIRLALFLGFVILAVYVDRLLNRYLKGKGLIE